MRLQLHNSCLQFTFYNRIRWKEKTVTPSLSVMRSRRGKSFIGHSCFQLCVVSKRGGVLLMAANYSLSSAPGQACAWRVRPHFRKGQRRRIGGSGRGKNVNPRPPWKSPNSLVLHPSSCQMKWCRLESVSVVTDRVCVCVCVCICGNQG